ncbi:DUF2956 domain-containing protein [Methylomarinum sp. Ch1-1]|uniref:DUF2956 domain-containing protein n=1 Tax=Methylomarinum roseum TaxID=3067653 RepID=A0AAU7NTQ4_9GAMM|nr:DUF2956 domain-containing protein [Methylomarinum sp. Ch1-1]MDP4519571.1 DUF2956 domain-containing protein [Methylomarinum sp. Ch1-1]
MRKNKSYRQISAQTQEESLKTAKATQRPGQTKEQTKLIAQGIQKGIEQYKKQQKAKARELDKKLKKVDSRLNAEDSEHKAAETVTIYRQSKLAWILLLLSWLGFALCFAMYLN